MPPVPTVLLGAAGAIVVFATGCGGGDSANQAELEQARHQGAAAARRTAAIHELREEVASLRRSDSRTPEKSAEPPPGDGTVDGGDVGRVPASGTYYGQAQQRGERVSINKDYPIDMTFSRAGSTVDYPSLDCHGSLRPLGFDGPYRVYEETIVSGHCDSGGTWRVHVEDDSRLEATWSLSSVDYSVSAVLLS
jgi:hypothetical protein